MNIFNSLGSNYTLNTVRLSVLAYAGLVKSDPDRIEKKFLRNILDANWHFTYKGRHAITMALKQLGLGAKDLIATQAFTCWAVEEAILDSGAKPVFVDIEPNSTNLSVQTLEQCRQKNPRIKAVLVQHTLGFPAEIAKIKRWCQKHKLLLIEDLAHINGVSEAKQPIGSFGDATIISFGRDKFIDAVSGGAWALSSASDLDQDLEVSEAYGSDFFYPLATWLIRTGYSAVWGKALHKILRDQRWMKSPVASNERQLKSLHPKYLPLVDRAFRELNQNLVHRQKLARIYQKSIKTDLLLNQYKIDQVACLRYPIRVSNRDEVLDRLTRSGIHISDTWYRQTVDVSNLQVTSSYLAGSCPEAEKLAQQILNLPTHRNIQPQQAQKMIKLINAVGKVD